MFEDFICNILRARKENEDKWKDPFVLSMC